MKAATLITARDDYVKPTNGRQNHLSCLPCSFRISKQLTLKKNILERKNVLCFYSICEQSRALKWLMISNTSLCSCMVFGSSEFNFGTKFYNDFCQNYPFWENQKLPTFYFHNWFILPLISLASTVFPARTYFFTPLGWLPKSLQAFPSLNAQK